ncbi:MAG: hypothetical protein O3C28_08080 [Proteobacteria bacterium]|nr:hypothetical protein [Pseudomonadota bacterium]
MADETKGPNIPKDVKDRLQRLADDLKQINETAPIPEVFVRADDARWAGENIQRYLDGKSETLDAAFAATRSEGRPPERSQSDRLEIAKRALNEKERNPKKSWNTIAELHGVVRQTLRAWIREYKAATETARILADIHAELIEGDAREQRRREKERADFFERLNRSPKGK